MGKLSVAILWHQHQPYYTDPTTGTAVLPWVRLHAIKDYYGMAQLVREQPDMRLTINLVPSLLKQIEEITSGQVQDQQMQIALKPPADLSEQEVIRVLDECFLLNRHHMVRPYPRFRELLRKRQLEQKTASEIRRQFTEQDLQDLVVWYNLAWFHPCVVEQDADLAGLFEKGRGFSHGDLRGVIDKQLALMRQIIPLHRDLQQAGQVELSTTPFYHPILPLLANIDAAREARPELPLPNAPFRCPKDATVQVSKAVQYHRELFGVAPRGMWPSEGSVSHEIIPIVAEAGLQWLASDEGVLEQSLGTPLRRDRRQQLLEPERVYQPYRVEHAGRSVRMVFRDRHLSDLIGFSYQWVPASRAVDDLMARLHQIAADSSQSRRLVTIILDGENAWEHYERSGADFLRLLYRRLAEDRTIETVPIGEAVESWGESAPMARLCAGSWINHDFYTWVGDPEKNRAWECLCQTRHFLQAKDEGGEVGDSAALQQAWEQLYMAEGSDWFWWYGAGHSSNQDDEFDRLFRLHLQSVYRRLGEDPPDSLHNAICTERLRARYAEPSAFLQVTVDGRRTSFFEWVAAGHYDAKREQGAMHRASRLLIQHVYLGFDAERFYVRLDPKGGVWPDDLADVHVIVRFDHAPAVRLEVDHLAEKPPTLRLVRGAAPNEQEQALDSVALDNVLELACPFELLALREDEEVPFAVTVYKGDEAVQRAPESTTILLRVPSKNFDQIMWRV